MRYWCCRSVSITYSFLFLNRCLGILTPNAHFCPSGLIISHNVFRHFIKLNLVELYPGIRSDVKKYNWLILKLKKNPTHKFVINFEESSALKTIKSSDISQNHLFNLEISIVAKVKDESRMSIFLKIVSLTVYLEAMY